MFESGIKFLYRKQTQSAALVSTACIVCTAIASHLMAVLVLFVGDEIDYGLQFEETV